MVQCGGGVERHLELEAELDVWNRNLIAGKTSLWSFLMDRDGTESYIDPDGAGLVGCGGVVFVKKHGVGGSVGVDCETARLVQQRGWRSATVGPDGSGLQLRGNFVQQRCCWRCDGSATGGVPVRGFRTTHLKTDKLISTLAIPAGATALCSS